MVIINLGDPQNKFCIPSGSKINLERKAGRKINIGTIMICTSFNRETLYLP